MRDQSVTTRIQSPRRFLENRWSESVSCIQAACRPDTIKNHKCSMGADGHVYVDAHAYEDV